MEQELEMWRRAGTRISACPEIEVGCGQGATRLLLLPAAEISGLDDAPLPADGDAPADAAEAAVEEPDMDAAAL